MEMLFRANKVAKKVQKGTSEKWRLQPWFPGPKISKGELTKKTVSSLGLQIGIDSKIFENHKIPSVWTQPDLILSSNVRISYKLCKTIWPQYSSRLKLELGMLF